MTDEEIDAMEAGRELDALVAEKVMGWVRPSSFWPDTEWRNDAAIPPRYLPSPRTFNVKIVEAYSTDIAAAWLVVEKLKEAGFSLALEVSTCVGVGAKFWPATSHKPFKGSAETVPLAICRAALRAVAADPIPPRVRRALEGLEELEKGELEC